MFNVQECLVASFDLASDHKHYAYTTPILVMSCLPIRRRVITVSLKRRSPL